ncbi:3975_t:CDS:2 [Acaulospora colombiana]|uniref:3975_t:CDS:1 n=1 Tax=Acaulospora colombiana TaxID=27376 RepID=A0ACA9LVN3_9GLOM|nr:3975_t:CDS:2 [Acaulospora colombiana]
MSPRRRFRHLQSKEPETDSPFAETIVFNSVDWSGVQTATHAAPIRREASTPPPRPPITIYNVPYPSGQSATETSSLNYNKTISTSRSVSPFNSFLPYTDLGSQSGPSSRPYSTAESRTSMLDTGSHISSSTMGLLQPTDGNSVTKTTRRALPIPPHPPPSYESLSRMDDNNTQPTLAPSAKAAALGLPPLNPSSSSSPAYTTSEVPQSPYPYTSDTGTINNSPHLSPRESLQQTIVDPADYPTASGARKGQSEEGGGRFSESSTVRPHSIDAPAHPAVGRISESSARPLQSPITEEGFHDPFNATKYELPAWLNSDPFPSNHAGPSVRRSLSQSSLYPPKTPRSAAASSHVLPSEWSVRSLSPDLPDVPPLPHETGHHNTHVTITVSGHHPPQPPRSPTHMDLLKEMDHPPKTCSSFRERSALETIILAARGESSKDTTPTVVGEFVQHGQKQGEADARSSRLLTPSLLSDSVPGQGLGRSFTLDPSYRIVKPSRVMLRTSVGRAVNPSILNTSVLASSSTRPKSRVVSGVPASAISGNFINLHPLDSPSSRGMLTGSSMGNGVVAGPGLMRNTSTASRIVHGDLDSIRSVSPELGWIGEDAQTKETPLGQGKDEGRKEQQQPESSNKGSRGSRLSLGEAALLWAGLTSAMESEDKPRT